MTTARGVGVNWPVQLLDCSIVIIQQKTSVESGSFLVEFLLKCDII